MTPLTWLVSLPAWLYFPLWILAAIPMAWVVTRILAAAHRHDAMQRHQRAVSAWQRERCYRSSARLLRDVHQSTEGRKWD